MTTTIQEGVWTRWEYEHGEVIWTRECPAHCDSGLIYQPVRFCSTCQGRGWISQATDPATEDRGEGR